MDASKKEKYNKIAIIIIWIGSIIVLAVRYLLNHLDTFHDEAFFINEAVRFAKGDIMFVTDWNPGQSGAFLYYPLVKLWHIIVGSYDGIILFCRYIWFVIKLSVSIYCCYVINSERGMKWTLAVLLMWIYEPYNLAIMYYNSIVSLASCYTVVTALCTNKRRIQMFIMGLLWGCAVIAQPFCIIIPIAWIILSIVCKKKDKMQYVLLGGGIMAVSFAVFVLSRASLMDIWKSVYYILNAPSHVVKENYLFSHLFGPINEIFTQYPIITVTNIVLVGAIIFIKQKVKYYIPVAVAMFNCAILIFQKDFFAMNTANIAFMWMGIEELMLLCKKDPQKKRIYINIVVGSGLFVLATALGTNVGVLTMVGAMSGLVLLSLMMINELGEYESENREILHIGSILIVLFIVAGLRIAINWGDVIKVNDFHNMITDGPLNGTLCDDEIYKRYYEIYNDITDMKLTKEDNLLVLTDTQMAYLCTDAMSATPDTTIGELPLDIYYEFLKEYYDKNPNKFPSAVYAQEGEEKVTDTKVYKWLKLNKYSQK